jgi:heme-degrading monooxygenase HmoA
LAGTILIQLETPTMILEAATINVKAEPAFESAFADARKVVSAMPGFIALQLHRCIESDGRYLLLVQWRSVEDHTVGFRQSPQFLRWRELIGPYFAGAPFVEHYESVYS